MENNNVKIKIRSQIYDLFAPELGTPEEMMLGKPVHFPSEREDGEINLDDVIEFTTEGKLVREGDRYEISYDETEEMGMENSRTTLIADITRPNTVSMVRRGQTSSSLVFDSIQKRQQCSYNTEFFPIELCICTKDVAFELSGLGGMIDLDYTIEIRGVKTERNIFSMSISPLDDGCGI